MTIRSSPRPWVVEEAAVVVAIVEHQLERQQRAQITGAVVEKRRPETLRPLSLRDARATHPGDAVERLEGGRERSTLDRRRREC
eukprot:973483-Prymnesium_polylepis.1